MAGRARGRKTTSLTREQLQAMGVVGREIPQVLTAPPPTYPPLHTKPLPLDKTAEPKCLEKYSDQFSSDRSAKKENPEFNQKRLPLELCTAAYRKMRRNQSKRAETSAGTDKQPVKKVKISNITDRLKILGEKEIAEENLVKVEKSDTESEKDEKEILAIDEEMDDENDYGFSYFDNGEAYNEDDDNDDGPVF